MTTKEDCLSKKECPLSGVEQPSSKLLTLSGFLKIFTGHKLFPGANYNTSNFTLETKQKTAPPSRRSLRLPPVLFQLHHVLLGQVLVPEAPDVRAVTTPQRAPAHHPSTHGLAVVRPAQACECVDEPRRPVDAVLAELRGLVVVREHVMVVVPALAQRAETNEQALR